MLEWIWANLTMVIAATAFGLIWFVSGAIFGIRGSAEKMRKYRFELRDKNVNGLEIAFIWILAFVLGPISFVFLALKKIFGKGG